MPQGSSARHTLALFAFLLLPAGLLAQQSLSADSLYAQGIDHYNKRDYHLAQPLLERAYALLTPEADSSAWLNAGMYLGTVLQQRSRHKRALQHFREFLGRGRGTHTPYSLAYIHSCMGQLFNTLAMPDSALRHFETALPHAVKSNNSTMVGAVYNSIGSTHYATGAYRKSLENRRRALAYYREQNDSTYIASALNNIGLVYRDLGIYDQALDYMNRSLAIREKLGSDDDMATIYNNIGLVQKELGHYDQALVAYRNALEFNRRTGQPESSSLIYNNIGVLYAEMGDSQTALEYYWQALEAGEDRLGPDHLSSTYRNIGSRLWDLERHDEALNYYERALELRRRTGNPHTVASSYWDLAKVNIQRGNLLPAAIYIEEGSFLADTTGLTKLQAEAAHWRGRLHFEQEEFERALAQFRSSWQISSDLPSHDRILPLTWLSHTFNRLGSDSTLHYGQRAVELIERSRERVGQASRMRQDYLRQYTGFYLTLAARTLDHGGPAAEAYKLVEASRARTLSDELRQASLRIDEHLPEDVRLERSRHLNRLQELYLKRESAVREASLDSLNRLIRDAELAWSSYQNELAQTYPRYRQLELPEPATLAEAQALCPPNTAILEYAVAGDRLIVFLISRNRTVARSLPLGRGEEGAGMLLSDQVQQFRDAILAQASPGELERLSAPLLESLIDPVARSLGAYERIMVAPDGALAYLPFEALRRNGRYLIEDHTLKYIPSVTSLQLLESPPEQSESDLLAVAGSEFTGGIQDPGMGGSRTFVTLPSTLVEVDSIAARFQRTTILKNDDVSEEAVRNRMNGTSYRYIHLATHGRIDEEQPAMSGLALGRSGELEAADLNDGMLRSSEIYRLRLNTRMVVLSACNTGMGPLVSGEGILGLQRSFFYAGAPTVVVSLWSVGDRSTSYMMPLFYRELSEETEDERSWWMWFGRWAGWERSLPYGATAEAMRRTKLAMIEHPLLGHPIHWAPFIPVGR